MSFFQDMVLMNVQAGNFQDMTKYMSKCLRRISRVKSLKLGFYSISNSRPMDFLANNMRNIVVDLVFCDLLNSSNSELSDLYAFALCISKKQNFRDAVLTLGRNSSLKSLVLSIGNNCFKHCKLYY